jgi:DNA-binding MarR family transcriptional regulator
LAKKRFLRSVRLLALGYQSFERISGAHVRELGLTPAQFDIVAALGNTAGMPFHELGEKALITKGTLTGVVDRLERRGIVARVPSDTDGRSSIVGLTAAGERLFEQVFDAHIAHCARAFVGWRDADFAALDAQLQRLCDSLHAHEFDGGARMRTTE